MKNRKTIFTLNVSNVVDIITNSSSELFVLKGKTKEIVEEMIKEIHPEYLTEYESLKSSKELTAKELDTYLDYKMYYTSRSGVNAMHDDSMFGIPPEILWINWNNRNEQKYYYKQLTDEGAELVKQKVDPKNEMYFLFSIDDNPNWDIQEKLMEIGERYHLG